jgi:hypothetical protein
VQLEQNFESPEQIQKPSLEASDRKQEDPILWHYTVGRRLIQILRDGRIRPAIAGVPASERPIVWFTRSPKWEQTANKLWRAPDGRFIALNQQQTAERCGGLARIGVSPDTAPSDWKTLRELSGMSTREAYRLYNSAIRQGSRPGDWRGAFDAVPQSRWIAIELYEAGEWRRVPKEQSVGLIGRFAPEDVAAVRTV